jgi:hypothetical protein
MVILKVESHALPTGVPLVQPPCFTSHARWLGGLTDEERGPCPLSVAQPPLFVEPCSVAWRARQGEPCSPHLVFRWCFPLALRAMLAGLDGLTDEERGPCPLSVAQPPLLVEP